MISTTRSSGLIISLIAAILVTGTNAAWLPVHRTAATEQRYTIDAGTEDLMGAETLSGGNTTTHRIRIALKLRNMDALLEYVQRISDPLQPHYYQEYMTAQEVERFTAPSQGRVDAVVVWLTDCNASSIHVARGAAFIEFSMTVRNIMACFQGRVVLARHHFEKGARKQPLVGLKFSSKSYFIPDQLTDVVHYVQSMAEWPVINRAGGSSPFRSTEGVLRSYSNHVVVTKTLRNLYNFHNYTFTAGDRSAIGVLEFSGSYGHGDVQTFLKQMGEPGPNSIRTHSGSNTGHDVGDGECQLDIEMVAGLGTNSTAWFVTTNGYFDSMVQELGQMATPPLLSSISYNSGEGQTGKSTMQQFDHEAIKLAARGIAVAGASGDGGACSGGQLVSNFPPCSANVIAVGATMVTKSSASSTWPPDQTGPKYCASRNIINGACVATGKEDPADVVSGGFASGGGFGTDSSVYPIPSWQRQQVEAYLNSSIPKPPSGSFNAKARAYPDIAANGNNIIMWYQGGAQMTGGTSASAPIIVTLLSAVNDVLHNHGKRPLGFPNSFLYNVLASANGGAIKSIGSNSTNNKCGCRVGWTSNPSGWDPVTGLGTLDVAATMRYVKENLHMFKDI